MKVTACCTLVFILIIQFHAHGVEGQKNGSLPPSKFSWRMLDRPPILVKTTAEDGLTIQNDTYADLTDGARIHIIRISTLSRRAQQVVISNECWALPPNGESWIKMDAIQARAAIDFFEKN